MFKRILTQIILVIVVVVLTTIFQPLSYFGVTAQGGCHTFVETGKTVCGRFLQYWQSHGGLAQQGFPLSGEFIEVSDLNGQPYTVQYFERAVFEYHPENAQPNDVLLSQLGSFQFKRKYPSGEPSSQPPTNPTPTRTTPPPSSSAKLEILDWNTYSTNTTQGLRIVGVAKNTGGIRLGSVKIVVTLKDATGRITDTASDSGPGGMAPDDIWPFKINFLGNSPSFTSVEFQVEAKAATDFDNRYFYRDFQVTDQNVLPPDSEYSGLSVVGNIRNSGSGTANYPAVYVAVFDGSGKVIDADYEISQLTELGPGQSSPFKVEMSKAREAGSVRVVAYSSRK